MCYKRVDYPARAFQSVTYYKFDGKVNSFSDFFLEIFHPGADKKPLIYIFHCLLL